MVSSSTRTRQPKRKRPTMSMRGSSSMKGQMPMTDRMPMMAPGSRMRPDLMAGLKPGIRPKTLGGKKPTPSRRAR